MNNSAEVKPKKKKTWLSFVFVGINILVIVLMALSEFGNQENPGKPFGAIVRLLGENWYFILLAVGAFLLIILCESLKYFVMIRACTGRNMPSASFEVAAMGQYYDFITPSGTGGHGLFYKPGFLYRGRHCAVYLALIGAGDRRTHEGCGYIRACLLFRGAGAAGAVFHISAAYQEYCLRRAEAPFQNTHRQGLRKKLRHGVPLF